MTLPDPPASTRPSRGFAQHPVVVFIKVCCVTLALTGVALLVMGVRW